MNEKNANERLAPGNGMNTGARKQEIRPDAKAGADAGRSAGMTLSDLKSTLVASYRARYTKPPQWAWPLRPSIPFIGKHYEPGESLLVYASAENLSWMARDKNPPGRYFSEEAWDRYRAAYEERGRHSDDFFPEVGIAPVEKGALLTAALFLAHRLGLRTCSTPRDFLETIAVTNWCKFSIASPKNRDYIADEDKAATSLPFVTTELGTLQPGVVLLPKTIWRIPRFSSAMSSASPGTRFLQAPQFNATVVNCHLSRRENGARNLRQRSAGTPLAEWMENLRGVKEANAWRYLDLLSSII